MNEIEQTALEALRAAAELKAGRKMKTPKDFDYLHDSIYEHCHEMVSTSTLKRLWGYNKYDGTPRASSLDPIARFVGSRDWNDFLQATSDKEEQQVPANPRRHLRTYVLTAIILVVAVIGGFFLLTSQAQTDQGDTIAPSGRRVLHKGQDCFRTIDEYLAVFGQEATDTACFRPLSGHEYVYLWGPEYQHPVWHNEGDSSLLMPTITEYWTPLPGEQDFYHPEYVKLANEKLYYERMDKDELRITFMKNIVDGFYVFLGIYRMDKQLSSPEKTVWRRVSDQCDLGNLNYIERLRSN